MFANALLLAAAGIFGDWGSVMSDDGNPGALTINDSGQFFGQVCVPAQDTCEWIISMTLSCTPGAEYVVLMNAASGAGEVKLRCDRFIGERWRYVFTDTQVMADAVASGKKIAFAIALPDEQFRVVRFSLDGNVEARKEMFKNALERQNKSTTDINL
jgi:hypothetical protein